MAAVDRSSVDALISLKIRQRAVRSVMIFHEMLTLNFNTPIEEFISRKKTNNYIYLDYANT